MTSTKGEMMESIFISMIFIKYQLTWNLNHACTASRVNVHLISQSSACLQGNESEGPLAPGPGRCTLPPFGPPSCPRRHPSPGVSPSRRAVQVALQGSAAALSAGQRGLGGPGGVPCGYRAGSARPPRPCAAGVSAAPGEPSPAGWIRVGLGRVFFLPEERHM